MIKFCIKCNKEFKKPQTQSLKTWGFRKYCSKSCANSINKNGKLFKMGDISWKKGLKFGENPINTKVEKLCPICNNKYKIKKSNAEKRKYCSFKCFIIDKGNPLRKEEDRIRKSHTYKKWRTSVFERDNYTCQECDVRGGILNADHIKSFSLYPELRFDINNGRTLCIECHRKTDTYGGKSFKNKTYEI